MSVRAPAFWTPEILEFATRLNAAYFAAGRPNIRVTSWWRDRATNARVGGAANSQHLTALAVDLVGDVRALHSALVRQGLVPINEGDHLHVQRHPGGGARGLCCGMALRVVR